MIPNSSISVKVDSNIYRNANTLHTGICEFPHQAGNNIMKMPLYQIRIIKIVKSFKDHTYTTLNKAVFKRILRSLLCF